MVNLDKLLKSFENLKVFHSGVGSDDPLSSANKLKSKDASTISKKDKISNCNNIADAISSNQIKQAAEFPKFMSLSIELFLSLCDDSEPDVRIVADECLNRVIKSVLDSNVSRLQVELYKEVKKNESSRSLRTALTKFADLCHYIKPQKCRPYVLNLLPCLAKISQRDDEGIQECLATSMYKICPVLMSFANDIDTKILMKSFLSNAKSSSANTRRTAAICLALICSHSRKPQIFFQWLINYLLEHLSSVEKVMDLHGLLLILRHLLLHLPNVPQHRPCMDHPMSGCTTSNCSITPSCVQVLKILQAILEFMDHSDHNIVNTALECLLQLLRNIQPPSRHLFVTPGSFRSLLPDKDEESSSLQEGSDALKTPDTHFPPEIPDISSLDAVSSSNDNLHQSDSTDLLSDELSSCHVTPSSEKPAREDQPPSLLSETLKDSEDEITLDVSAAIQAVDSFGGVEGDIGDLLDPDEVPAVYLARFLCSKFLLSGSKGGLIPDRQVKVSVKVLAVHLISILIQLHPPTLVVKLHKRSDAKDLQDIRDVLLYISHSDPQLKGNVALLIGAFISSRSTCRCVEGPPCDVERLLSTVTEMCDDESSVTTRCAIKSLQSSLPVLMDGCHGDAVVKVLLGLVNVKANCYWLVKVEILHLLSDLNFKTLYFLGKSVEAKKSQSHFKVDVQDVVIENVIGLLGDEDHRVRQAAVNSICRMIPQLFYPSDEIHPSSLVAMASQMVLLYLPVPTHGQHPTDSPCHKMESALSRIITRIMRCLTQSSNKNFTLGCCSALCQLSEEYKVQDHIGAWLSLFKQPTTPISQPNNIINRIMPRSKSNNGISSSTLPNMNNDDWSMTLVGGPLLFILSTLTSSPLSHDLHFLSDGMKLAGNLFIGTSMHNLRGQKSGCSDQSHSWSVISDKYLALLGDKLLIHVLRMLNIFQHILDDVTPNSNQSKSLPSLPTPPSLSPIKRKSKAGKEGESSQSKNASTNQDRPTAKEPIREGLGSFTNSQHYVQLFTVLKSSYMSYKISSELVNDKFLQTLKSTLAVLSQLLELATVNEVSRCAEELLSYLASAFSVDPSATLVCVRQLLRSIFGTNMSLEESGQSPNRHQIYSTCPTSQLRDSLKLYDVCFKLPANLLLVSGLHDDSALLKKTNERIGPALMAKIFSKTDKSSVGAYIKLFEPLVIRALKQYTLTSLSDVQFHVLDLLTTLVQLRVNYCLLDSDQIFIGFILKQIEMIETGQSRATDVLLPEIFNFLIQLSFEKYNNKNIITMSKIIQLCDGIIASELDPSIYAVPCLGHIVSTLFNPENRQSDPKEMETQREVVVSMLLRLIKFSQILDMLSVVLRHSRADGDERLNKLSRQISDHLFPALIRHEIIAENAEDLSRLTRLLENLSPCVFRPVDILVNIMFSVPVQQQELRDSQLARWVAQVICCLRILLSVQERDVVLFKISQMGNSTPLFSFPTCRLFTKSSSSSPPSSSSTSHTDGNIGGLDGCKEESGEMIMAEFLLTVVDVLLKSIMKAEISPTLDVRKDSNVFLCQEMFHLLILVERLLDFYPEVLTAVQRVMTSSSPWRWVKMTDDFSSLLVSHPPVFLRWCSIVIITAPVDDYLQWWSLNFPLGNSRLSANVHLAREAGFMLICHQVSEGKSSSWRSSQTINWLVDHHFRDIVAFSHDDVAKKLLGIIHGDSMLSHKFCGAVKAFYAHNNNENSPSISFTRWILRCLESSHPTQAGEMLKLLITTFLSTCYLPITKAADRLACSCAELLLATEVDKCREIITPDEIRELVEHLKSLNLNKNQLSSLLLKLIEHLKKVDVDNDVGGHDDDGLTSERLSQIKSNDNDHDDDNDDDKDDGCNFKSIQSFEKDEYLRIVKAACLNSKNKHLINACPNVLINLDYSTILSIFMNETCSPLLLASCMRSTSSELTSRRLSSWLQLPSSSSKQATTSAVSKMFKAASFALQRNLNRVVNLLPTPYRFFRSKDQTKDPYDLKMIELFSDQRFAENAVELAQALQVFLECVASSSSPPSSTSSSSSPSEEDRKKVEVPESNVKDICRFCVFYLEMIHWNVQHGKKGVSSLDLLTSLTCINLCLSIQPISSHLSSPDDFLYVCSSVHAVHSLLFSFVTRHSSCMVAGQSQQEIEFQEMSQHLDELNLMTRTCDLMCELILSLSTHLHTPSSSSPPSSSSSSSLPLYLRAPFRKVIVALGRVPLVNSYARTPSLVWSMGWSPTPTGGNKTKLPPIPLEFLQDKDVLSDYIFRVSAIGWTNRHQFEETWMSLLAVLNPVSNDESQSSHEECLEKTHCQILSMRAITSLLLSTTLTPSPGNPSVSFFKHKPRNKLINFFKSSNGQKLLRVKMRLEMDLWGMVADDGVEFEGIVPLMNNLEREIGDFSFSPAQFSTSYIVSMMEELNTNESSSNIVRSIDQSDDSQQQARQEIPKPETKSETNPEFPPPTSTHDIDVHSCLQFLLELYSSFLSSPSTSSSSSSPSPKTPLSLLNETVRSILLLSDVFTDRAQYEWLLMMMLDMTKNHPVEDELLACYVILATCKAAVVVGVDTSLSEKIVKLVDANLRSTHLPTKIFTLYGGLYILESNHPDVAHSLIPIFVDYLLRSLGGFTPSTIHSQQHALVMWSLAFFILENYHVQVEELEFSGKFFQICHSMVSTYQDSTPLPIFSAILAGLERLAISRSLDLDSLVKLATDRFCQQNTQRSLMAFNLMVTCMYIDYLRPKEISSSIEDGVKKEEEQKDFMSDADATMRIMERITVIFDRIRKGLPQEALTIMKVLPLMLIDFFEGHEIMNKIIVEFLGNQQPQTQLFARLIFQVFEHLLQSGQSQLVINWVILSLSNFTQKTPLPMAIWSLTCIFICSSGNPWLRSIYPMVVRRIGMMDQVDVHLFQTSALDFYKSLLSGNESQAESFRAVFRAASGNHKSDNPYVALLDAVDAVMG